jgi:hypothetical protein
LTCKELWHDVDCIGPEMIGKGAKKVYRAKINIKIKKSIESINHAI